MINVVIILLKTFIQITFFRKSPADVPNSTPILIIVSVIWYLIGLLNSITINLDQEENFLFDLVLVSIGLIIYSLIINLFGYSERIIRCIIAILGCSVIFSIILFVGQLVLSSMFANNGIRLMMQIIWLWSIPVEGYIIAHTINRQWVTGFLITIAVLFMQLQFFALLKPIF
ncbi:MAG: hypothetical protein CMQ54_05645 [Gammaproteobacteria bacterium]|nr:hypothetical protein [Gammaproteobacteria bacterium]|tara:strand:+ start:203 stop:718 length:516 start_codon:yes stop_codon:yes gene_type:complete